MPAKPTDPMASGPYPTLPEDYGVHDRGGDRGPQIRHSDPRVAEHCARMLVKYGFDYAAVAAAMLATKIESLEEERRNKLVAIAAETLEKSPYVAKALQILYGAIGMGDDALKLYLAGLWEMFQDKNAKNQRLRIAAMSKLGEALGINKKADQGNKPKPLPIQGFDEGVKHMMGGALPSQTEIPDVVIEDDESVQ